MDDGATLAQVEVFPGDLLLLANRGEHDPNDLTGLVLEDGDPRPAARAPERGFAGTLLGGGAPGAPGEPPEVTIVD